MCGPELKHHLSLGGEDAGEHEVTSCRNITQMRLSAVGRHGAGISKRGCLSAGRIKRAGCNASILREQRLSDGDVPRGMPSLWTQIAVFSLAFITDNF